MPVALPELPIDAVLPEIAASLRTTPNLVLVAAPGAGKTTRVPASLLSLVAGSVLVLEPRRIAARLAAARTAAEMGEAVGETVGFQVRFEEAVGPRTRLRFVTEGVLTRRLLSDPELRGVDAVVRDEFHERHLDTDLALALLKELQGRRSELKLIVMSATLEAAPLARFFGECPVLRAEGRSFPLAITHLPYSPHPLEVQVRGALERLLREEQTGHVLVFLPGAGEIRRCMRECGALARSVDALLLPLYGNLPPAEQDQALAPSKRRKIILSTNVAESSVTIEGVTAVVDSGIARFATYSPWSGLPTLELGRISKASAAQRAGRAGRTRPGVALRLYPQEDFAQRPEHDVPAILRSDLAGLCLTLRAMGFPHVDALEWLDAPPEAAVAQAETLLDRLGATGQQAGDLARFPLPPRLARVLLDAEQRGAAEEGIAATALLSSGARGERTDLLSALDGPPDQHAQQQRRQLRRLVRPRKPFTHDDQALLLSLLKGFPDRVARLRADKLITLCTGVSAELAGERPPYEFMVVVEAEDRKEKQMPLVRLTARVEPEWLLDLFPERLREESVLEWNRSAERVDAVNTLRYDELVIEESRDGRPEPQAAAEMLAGKAVEHGLEHFLDRDAFQQLQARLGFAGMPEADLSASVRSLCAGLRSFAALREAARDLLPMLERNAGPALQELAPPTLRLPGGRQTKVHYELGKPPWIASRLQDFFGMRQTPRIGRDRTPVVVQLLAPNQRAVQTTTDLAGFWERLYPQVRRELMRRYPRHAWPERP